MGDRMPSWESPSIGVFELDVKSFRGYNKISLFQIAFDHFDIWMGNHSLYILKIWPFFHMGSFAFSKSHKALEVLLSIIKYFVVLSIIPANFSSVLWVCKIKTVQELKFYFDVDDDLTFLELFIRESCSLDGNGGLD